jgi:trehalose 6-phosphate synthase
MSHNAWSPTLESTDDRIERSVQDRNLIVVSNRQPYSHDYDAEGRPSVDQPTGGLTEGLDPIVQRIGEAWIAWGGGDADAEVVDGNDCVDVPPENPAYRLKRVWLSDEAVQDYYYGFSNQVLWPLCHSALTRVRCDPSFWERYQEVNEQFADAVADYVDEQPLVWFQDYHLALAPRMVRPHLPDNALLMQFWHIPWPSWDTYRACPHGRELLEGVLGNDLFGVHLPRYRENFLRCADAQLDDAQVDWETGEVRYRGGVTTVRSTPMGVPFDRIQESATTRTAETFESSFRRDHDVPDDARIAVGVDRLDYSKGIVERLHALERLWEDAPEWREALTYVQSGSESRSQIRDYQEVQDRVAELVHRINERFGTDDWQPVVYTTDRLSQEELYGLYRAGDLGIVSPIRDGMNLVAQEYVAAQVDNDGVLLLSDQAGVHDEVGDHAVSITPSDTAGFADAIAEALVMVPEERHRRMAHLRRWAAINDLDAWVRGCLPAEMTDSTPDSRPVSTAGHEGEF